ncbi:hypothetical protein MiSe_42170 [Microseira wollei NIES-4236]|uniref:DUF218 domain-containing protein n=2 Tax=Microseira wollei TaxID=467598 RepID=A0AAV3XDE8_9CYAN|nr:hypothetical protein MiSe_42170 [Microseira wollei NIES-4236]
MMQLSGKIKKRLKLMFLGVASALLVGIGYISVSIYIYGTQQNEIKADAAIVLGAAVWGNQPSPVFRERINHAIQLYKTGKVQRIIFTGGVGNSNETAEAIVAKNYAFAQKIPATNILIETSSRTTHQNLKNAKIVANNRRLTKFLIVSDPLHMKRSVLMARDLGLNAYPSPTPTTRYRSLNGQLGFLARETYFYIVYLIWGI